MANGPKPKKREGTSKDHDFTVKARSILDQVIDEHLDETRAILGREPTTTEQFIEETAAAWTAS